jgi:hypothetical protein
VTFNLVCLAWVFFRANSMGDALLVLQGIAAALTSGSLEASSVPGPFLWAAALLVGERLQARKPHVLHLPQMGRPLRWAIYYGVLASILFFANLDHTPFIYFQF